jgi:hypothetical protein
MSILLSRSVNPENSYRWLKPPGAEFSETEGAVLSSGPEPPGGFRRWAEPFRPNTERPPAKDPLCPPALRM